MLQSESLQQNTYNFSGLSSQYNCISDILNDPNLTAYAYAADIKPADLANILIKHLAISQGVISQDIKVPLLIDANGQPQEKTLTKIDSKQPLKYEDILTDRSGPKFGGYLNDQVGQEYLIQDSETFTQQRRQIIEQRIAETQAKFPNADPHMIALAAGVFNRGHRTQRKLSDFDLTASSLEELTRSIKFLVEMELNQDIPTNSNDFLKLPAPLAKEIANCLWEVGGYIDVTLIKQILTTSTDINYRDEMLIKAQQNFTHILVDGPGKNIFAENVGLPNLLSRTSCAVADATYGLGVAFMGAEVRSDPNDPSILHLTSKLILDYNNQLPPFNSPTASQNKQLLALYFPGEKIEEVIKHQGLYELGDIICDSKSHYDNTFSHSKNIKNTILNLESCQQNLLCSIIDSGEIDFPTDRFPTYEQLSTLMDKIISKLDSEQEIQKIQDIANQMNKSRYFIDNVSIFEECAKKDAQSQIFKQEGSNEINSLRAKLQTMKELYSVSAPLTKQHLETEIVKVNQELEEALNKTSINTKKKLIGNISDTEPFISGVVQRAASDDIARAHMQLTVLSLLINSTRWSINSYNHKTLGEGEDVSITAFQQSINSRSYSYNDNETGPRTTIGWNNITENEASQRVSSFQEHMQPIWNMARAQKPYYQAADNLKRALKSYNAALNEYRENPTGQNKLALLEMTKNKSKYQSALKAEIKNIIITQMPEFFEQVLHMNPTSGEQEIFFNTLLEQAQQSIEFGVKREARLAAKADIPQQSKLKENRENFITSEVHTVAKDEKHSQQHKTAKTEEKATKKTSRGIKNQR